MGKRGVQKIKINNIIAHIKWLLYTNTPPTWATAEKLTAELDFLKECLQLRKPNTATHSAKVINETLRPGGRPAPTPPEPIGRGH